MYDDYRIMEHLEKEMDKKAENGIRSTADLEVVSKLAQIMKDLAKVKYYCTVTKAMEEGGYSEDDGHYMGGHSERRKRDSMGRYARNDGGHYGGGVSYEGGSSYRSGYSEAKGEYMDAKHSYRTTRDPGAKREMETSLKDCMQKLRQELDEMEANADTREEREKIREMRREIGKLE